jgi:chromosome segregation ATPase
MNSTFFQKLFLGFLFLSFYGWFFYRPHQTHLTQLHHSILTLETELLTLPQKEKELEIKREKLLKQEKEIQQNIAKIQENKNKVGESFQNIPTEIVAQLTSLSKKHQFILLESSMQEQKIIQGRASIPTLAERRSFNGKPDILSYYETHLMGTPTEGNKIIEIEFIADYRDVQNFLQELNALPVRIFPLNLTMRNFPPAPQFLKWTLTLWI